MSKKKKIESTERVSNPVQDRLNEALERDFAHVIILGLTENDVINISTSFSDFASIHAGLSRAAVDVVIAHNNAARRNEEDNSPWDDTEVKS